MKSPWAKFYFSDWRSDPRLRMCGLTARGLWIEMLALMHEAEPYGHLTVHGRAPTDTQLAVLTGAPPEQIPDLLGELESAGVFSRTQKGVIYSRRMTRDAKRSQIARQNGKLGGNPTLSNETENPGWDNQEPKPPDKVKHNTQKPEARIQKENTSCDFDRFWKAWPDKTCPKKPARIAFDRALKREPGGIDVILAGIERNAANKPEWKNWPHAATWLNQDRWADLFDQPTSAASAAILDAETSRWGARLFSFAKHGIWDRGQFGPAPGEPGCQAPIHLIEEYRKGKAA